MHLEDQEEGLKAENKNENLLQRLFLSLPLLQGAQGLLWYYSVTYLFAINTYILGKWGSGYGYLRLLVLSLLVGRMPQCVTCQVFSIPECSRGCFSLTHTLMCSLALALSFYCQCVVLTISLQKFLLTVGELVVPGDGNQNLQL